MKPSITVERPFHCMKFIGKFSLVILAIAFAVCAECVSFGKSLSKFSAPSGSKAKLQLSATIIEQQYCSSTSLSFRLKVALRNTGPEPVILEKKILWDSTKVSQDLKAAASGKYVQELRADMYHMPPDFGFDPPADLTNFFILKHGEVHEFEQHVSVGVNDGRPHAKVLLRPGTYFLQIGFGTWHYVADPMSFRRKWKDNGYLWSGGLISEPIRFTVEQNPAVVKCS